MSEKDERRQIIGHIQHHVRLQHTREEAFRSLQKAFGLVFMEKWEFDHWFEMFTKDLDYRWSPDPFCPTHDHIDTANCTRIHITISMNSIYVKYDEIRVKYTAGRDDSKTYPNYGRNQWKKQKRRGENGAIIIMPKKEKEEIKVIKTDNYLSRVLDDLRVPFSNEAKQYESLLIEYHQRMKSCGTTRKAMERTGRKFFEGFLPIIENGKFFHEVRKLSVQTDDLIIFQIILNNMKPGKLEEMELVNVDFPVWRKSDEERKRERKDLKKYMTTVQEIMEEDTKDEDQFFVQYEKKQSDYMAFKRSEDSDSSDREEYEMRMNMEKDNDVIDQREITQLPQFKQTVRVYWLHNKVLRIPIQTFFYLNVCEIYHVDVSSLDIITLTGHILDKPLNNFERSLFYHPDTLDLTNLVPFYDLYNPDLSSPDQYVSKKLELHSSFVFHLGDSEFQRNGSAFMRKCTEEQWEALHKNSGL